MEVMQAVKEAINISGPGKGRAACAFIGSKKRKLSETGQVEEDPSITELTRLKVQLNEAHKAITSHTIKQCELTKEIKAFKDKGYKL